MNMRNLSIIAVLALPFVLAGCATRGSNNDSPVARNLSWFSYVGGQDIRAACTAAAAGPEHYRLVYNARYNDQVRVYDITALPSSGGALLSARVRGGTQVAALELGDPLAPWQTRLNQRRLGKTETEALISALEASDAFTPTPAGRRLNSATYFWVVSACREGRFTLSVFEHPSTDLGTPAFVKPLAKLDPSNVPFPAPQALDALPPSPAQCGSRRGGPREGCLNPPFILETSENGLIPGLEL